MSRPVMYIFVNKSLHMSAGKVGAQTVQAAIGAYRISNDKLVKSWWNEGGHHTTLIMEARDEKHLSNISDYLFERGFNSFMMIDEGMTEIDAHTMTALAVVVVDKEDAHTEKTFQSFKLYRDSVRLTIEVDK